MALGEGKSGVHPFLLFRCSKMIQKGVAGGRGNKYLRKKWKKGGMK